MSLPTNYTFFDSAKGDVHFDTAAVLAVLGNIIVGNVDEFNTTSSGAETLIPSNPNDRIVQITIQVNQVFADGDGAQPTFEIGETGFPHKFAATSVFTDAASGTIFSFAGILDADTDLIVTGTAGTGSTETGAMSITALTVPLLPS